MYEKRRMEQSWGNLEFKHRFIATFSAGHYHPSSGRHVLWDTITQKARQVDWKYIDMFSVFVTAIYRHH